MYSKSTLRLLPLVAIASIWGSSELRAEIKRAQFERPGGGYLAVEVLNDQVLHFELALQGQAKFATLSTSPYIAAQNGKYQANYSGPEKASFKVNHDGLETKRLELRVNPGTLCFSLKDKKTGEVLTEACPAKSKVPSELVLNLSKNKIKHAYGLGEQFLEDRLGSSNGDWIGQVRTPGGPYGNAMGVFPKHAYGWTGNNQFPILYATDDNYLNYSLFLDDLYKQEWDLRTAQWKIATHTSPIRGFLTVGGSLRELRRSYMDLVGHSLIPPKKAFGLWVSQYGFDSWTELESKLETLRQHHFPIDGFVLDLQWYGNVKANSEYSRMGALTFDESVDHFPNPAQKISSYWNNDGIGIIPIEESYMAKGLPEHQELESRCFLAHVGPSCASGALYMNENPWWGLGGMIDWTNPAAGSYWHRAKRQALVDLGVVGHWTDLGEPEMYRHEDVIDGKRVYSTPYYYGFPEQGKNAQADIHNIYSLKWHESIFKGYQEFGVTKRPFILSRSGGPGMQRYGAAMWSGDIGSRFGSLATHYNVEMQMTFSGLDYFGADIGGFHREDLDGDLNELYTQWFADAAAFDVPVRPHTENLKKTRETAPDRVGDLESNLENLRMRYRLSPYYYSLAHQAYLHGDPVVAPVVYYFQGARSNGGALDLYTLGDEKLIGKNLLVALAAKKDAKVRDIYLPPGEWLDYRTLAHYQSSGEVLKNVPLYRSGHLELPMFVKAGAIIPEMFVDEKTMNILGKRLDHRTHDELIATIVPSKEGSYFSVSEDDGVSIGYQKGEVAHTQIDQRQVGRELQVTIHATHGSYSFEDPNSGKARAFPETRQNVLKFVLPSNVDSSWLLSEVDSVSIKSFKKRAEFDYATQGTFVEVLPSGHKILWLKTGPKSVRLPKNIRVRFNQHG